MIIEVLIAASRKKPILSIVEDVQWIDPTSIELLLRVMARCQSERVLILITHRDDYDASWLSGSAIQRIALQKLAARECEQVVAAVAGTGFVPRRIISQIVERTDGVPLFIEEFTRSVIDSGAVERAADGLVLSGKLPEPLVPASIHDSLMERLDRLGTAKRVAQWKDLQRLWAQEVPIIFPYAMRTRFNAWRPNVKGFQAMANSSRIYLRETWVDR